MARSFPFIIKVVATLRGSQRLRKLELLEVTRIQYASEATSVRVTCLVPSLVRCHSPRAGALTIWSTLHPDFCAANMHSSCLSPCSRLATSVLYLRVTPPTYSGRVNVLFGAPKTQFFQQQSIMADAPVDLTQLETQLQILRSKAIAVSVITKLHLEEDPDYKAPDRRFGKILKKARTWFGVQASEPEIRTADGPSDDIIGAFEDRLSANRIGSAM